MRDFTPAIFDEIKFELSVIWEAHKRVGLKDGFMLLYTEVEQDVWRADEAGAAIWFGPDEIDIAMEKIKELYNNGHLPNSPLLLNPIVFKPNDDGQPEPVGSGIVWAAGLCLGVDTMEKEQVSRIEGLGAFCGAIHRGENKLAGLKMLAFSDTMLPALEGGIEVEGCRELYDVADFKSELYANYYMLSGLSYLSKNGSFQHPSFRQLFKPLKKDDRELTVEDITAPTLKVQLIKDASHCWQAYDRHHALYDRFGPDVKNLEQNLRFYKLCARDLELFECTGARAKGEGNASDEFHFLVDGWVPTGAVTLLAATGGTGKSSAAHLLAILAATDWKPDEPAPLWMGSPLNVDRCKGVCIYFSGEDGAAIVNARAEVYDPQQRAKRLMFRRTDFGEGVTLSQFMKRLSQMPDVPLVVIDPARKYLTGDEDDAGVVSEFFEAIEEFAITKGSAMVVVHHLAKGAKPESAMEVLDCLRGSQVFIDRPRVVIGMYRDGPYTCVGLAKNNIPPSLGMVDGERVFVRDPEKLQLVWLPGPEGVRNQMVNLEELEEIREQQASGKPKDNKKKADATGTAQ